MPAFSLAKMGKLLAADIVSGDLGDAARLVIRSLDKNPAIVIDVLDDLIKQGDKPEPPEDLIAADILMLANVLEFIRYRVEAGQADGIALVDRVMTRLLDAEAMGRIAPNLMLLILNQFAIAKLDVGDALRSTILRMMESSAAETGASGREDLRAMLRDAGDNPFDQHAALDEVAETLPEAAQAKLVVSLLAEPDEDMGNAAIGFLLSPSQMVRPALCAAIADLGTGIGAANPAGLRRMIALRNWLPESDRPGLDTGIKLLRQKGVACAEWPSPAKADAYVSGFDGSGMQGIFVIVPDGRKYAVCAMIGRLGMGVRDAWVRKGMAKKDVKAMLGQADGDIGMAPVSFGYVAVAARHFLAANLAGGPMPPFGLMAFAEAAGLSNLTPHAITADELIRQLMEQIEPARLAPATVATVLVRSTKWHDEHTVFSSWFEDSDQVSAALAGKKKPKAAQIAAVLAGPIARNRARWTELLAWTAFSTKQSTDDLPWEDFAIVARELSSGRALSDIPLMQQIARQTVEVTIERRRG